MLKIFLWGTGQIAMQVMNQYNVTDHYNVIGFIDNDKNKQGEKFFGKIIYDPSILTKEKFDKIIILANKYNEIAKQIKEILCGKTAVQIDNYKCFYKQSILKRYENCNDEEIKKILNYIREKDLEVFNYDFTDKYKDIKIDVEYDARCSLYYVLHGDKRMYFAKSLDTVEKVEKYYKSILLEQDKESPNRYLSDEFDISEGDVVVDAGVAEGNFSLDIIEKVSKIFMIESDIEWIEALKETFKDYMEKIVIIPRYLTSMEENECTTLDSVIEQPVDFIKMDIEGNEWDALLGAEKLINSSQNLKCAICSYHSDFDEILIKDILDKYGMECSATSGYMWFPFTRRKSYVSTKLCRGIVRGIKKRNE